MKPVGFVLFIIGLGIMVAWWGFGGAVVAFVGVLVYLGGANIDKHRAEDAKTALDERRHQELLAATRSQPPRYILFDLG